MRYFRSSRQGAFFCTFVLILLKIALFEMFLFEGLQGRGLVAEGLTVLALLCLVELLFPFKRFKLIYGIVNFIYSFTLFAATLYFAHFGTVPTYAVLSGLNQVPQVRASVNALIRPEQFLYFADFALLAVYGVFMALTSGRRRRTRSLSFRTDRGGQGRTGLGWKVGVAVLLVISIGSSGLFIASGRRIDNELVRAQSIGFLNFQGDALLRNQEEERMIAQGNLQEVSREILDLQAGYPYQDPGKAESSYFGAAQGMNLIVIQMESFQNFPIHLKLGQTEVTPVLNDLADEGFYFPKVYQQIGQGNTSDAEFMSNTSIYPTATVAMSTGFGSRELPSLPRLLQGHGYKSMTFHINDVTFWDRNRLYPALGFDKYFDKPAFNNDHFNNFGASDEEMYRVGVEALKKLDQQGTPFYAQFVTTSSHSPFIVPEDKVHIQLPDSLKRSNLGNYLTAANYTDYAIGELITRLKAEGMWDRTMLVVYGDHFGLQPSETSAAEIQEKLGIKYDDRISRFNIPFIAHIPGQKHGVVSQVTGGQVDLLPTVAGLLGLSLEEESFTAMGQDLLSIDRNVIGMRYYMPTGSFFNNDLMFVPGQGFEDGTALSLDTLEPVSDISTYRSDYEYILQLMKLSDEYVKLLPKRK